MKVAVENIKLLRSQYGFTREDMASLLCISVETYKNYENGQFDDMPVKVLCAIAKIFNVSVDFLVSDKDTRVHGDTTTEMFSDPSKDTTLQEKFLDALYRMIPSDKRGAVFVFFRYVLKEILAGNEDVIDKLMEKGELKNESF